MSAPPLAVPRRADARAVKAVLGPTNTGKTHLAVERMLAHGSGMIGLPLRLLAREIYDRVVRLKGAHATALITGEEKIAPPGARYFVCTVEAMPLERSVAFLAVDEVQLARDGDRGHVFTDRILHARGGEETMLLGAATMRPMLRRLVPDVEIIERARLSTLAYAGPRKLTKLAKRTAIVAFSAEEVYAIAELIRRQRGGAAVVMGALSPRTRNAQVALYQSGEVDFIVATDAIGMGLNMDVDHVAFASHAKFDGRRNRVLRPDEVAQIAGRAGRFQADGSWGETGDAAPFDQETIARVDAHEFEPIVALEWRNVDLDVSSPAALLRALERPPQAPGLVRTRGADDEEALKRLVLDEDITARARGPRAVRRLWEACQLPDFRKAGREEHARLVGRIAHALLSDAGAIARDWMAKEVARLDRVEGDLDALHQRLAHIRTWTFIAQRDDWIEDAGQWRERTRAIEDRLSDALHDLLTKRFIDRRTSALLRGLKREEALAVCIGAEGVVEVEGHGVGQLEGLVFRPDPSAYGLEGRAVRNAAQRALAPEVARRLAHIAADEDEAFELALDGRVAWRGAPVARLNPGPPLHPAVALLGGEDAPIAARAAASARIDAWLAESVRRELAPLLALAGGAGLSAPARGLAFRMIEAGGALDRASIHDLLAHLTKADRLALTRLGVRIGRSAVFAPKLLKPRAARLWSILRAGGDANAVFAPPAGLVSAPAPANITPEALAAAGFCRAGPAIVRFDILERLARALTRAAPEHAVLAGEIARPVREIPVILAALGYRQTPHGWVMARARTRAAAHPKDSPFASLAALHTDRRAS